VSALPEKATELAVKRRQALLAIHVPPMADPMVRMLRMRDLGIRDLGIRDLAIPGMKMSVTSLLQDPNGHEA
jgi:hypothetical protein